MPSVKNTYNLEIAQSSKEAILALSEQSVLDPLFHGLWKTKKVKKKQGRVGT